MYVSEQIKLHISISFRPLSEARFYELVMLYDMRFYSCTT